MHLTETDLQLIDKKQDAFFEALKKATAAVLNVNSARGLNSDVREKIAYIETLRAFGSRRKPYCVRKSVLDKDATGDTLGLGCASGMSCIVEMVKAAQDAVEPWRPAGKGEAA